MKSLILIILLALTATPIQAQDLLAGEESVDLEALYQQIEDAIRQSPEYVDEREQQIALRRDSLLIEKRPEMRLPLAEQLFLLYQPYRNDSALHYAEVCISIAESMQRPDLVGRYRAQLARQCSSADMHVESLEQLRSIDRAALDNAGLVYYYSAWMHVSGELASSSQRKDVRQRYFDLQNLYRDSVMMVADEGSEDWLHLKMDILSAQRRFQEALSVSNKWFRRVTPSTHESAYAAFYRSMCYDHLENHDLACYWLGKSALDDIRCAVMNQASLLFLAEHIANDGDISRAMRYMEFTKACNLAFCPRLRAYQVGPVVNITSKSNEAAQQQADLTLIISAAIIVCLLASLIVALLFIRKK